MMVRGGNLSSPPGSPREGETTRSHRENQDTIIKKLKREIEKKRGLGGIPLRYLLIPNDQGYAFSVVREAKLTRVQLRKIFVEFLNIFNIYENEYLKIKDPNSEEGQTIKKKIEVHLLKLYPLFHYQANRRLIEEDFRDLLVSIVDSLIENFTVDNFKHTKEFLIALVAYTKEDTKKES